MITYLSIRTSLYEERLPNMDSMIAAFFVIFETLIFTVVFYVINNSSEVSAVKFPVFIILFFA